MQAATRMEHLRRLDECNERRMSFRQAFLSLGMLNDCKSLKQLTAEEEFSALVNWALHKLPLFQSMILRINVDGAIYQTVVRKSQGHLRVGKIVRVTGPGGIAYVWPEQTKYDSLEVAIINDSVRRANEVNVERGHDLSVIERTQQAQEQSDELIMEERMQLEERRTAMRNKVGLQSEEEQADEGSQSEEKQADDVPWAIPKITMRQTERNFWEVVLTEEERELINEFLEK